jgi:hypothetical protein
MRYGVLQLFINQSVKEYATTSNSKSAPEITQSRHSYNFDGPNAPIHLRANVFPEQGAL